MTEARFVWVVEKVIHLHDFRLFFRNFSARSHLRSAILGIRCNIGELPNVDSNSCVCCSKFSNRRLAISIAFSLTFLRGIPVSDENLSRFLIPIAPGLDSPPIRMANALAICCRE